MYVDNVQQVYLYSNMLFSEWLKIHLCLLLRAISVENKGHKMLSKMGWKKGDALGKSQSGITEPVSFLFFSKFRFST